MMEGNGGRRTRLRRHPGPALERQAPEGRVYGWQLAAWTSHAVLIALAVPGLVIGRRRGAELWPLAALAAMVSVKMMLSYGNQRFRIAAEPSIVILAALTVSTLLPRDRGLASPTPMRRREVAAAPGG